MIKDIQSPLGKLYLQIDDGKLTAIHFHEPSVSEETSNSQNEMVFENAKQQLNEYFSGQRIQFDLPLNASGTTFQQSVWNELKGIEYGQTISYQELANRIGNAKACQAVGQANRKNPLPIVVPCHRVIGKDHSLKGYAGSLTPLKKILIDLERQHIESKAF
jgi:methylated-DNA-[protein]-cysteine S-methyltransferase